MSDDHSHDHDDDHAPVSDKPSPVSRYEILETAIRELLDERELISKSAIHAQIDAMDTLNTELGAKVVAKAWSNSDFRTRLIDDPRKTLEEMGIKVGQIAELKIVENSDDLHHVVTCTLCSCYPRMILGVPPAWYKSTAYRARIVREPRTVLKEFGVELPDATKIRVLDSTADLRFLVIPRRPEGTDGMSEEELAALVTRDSMIGTGMARNIVGTAYD